MWEFVKNLLINDSFKILIIVIVMDLIFGVLRAIREKKVNSSIGIDGMIRKTGMLVAVVLLCLIDNITKIDLIGFLPEDFRNFLSIGRVGISEIFSLLFIVFEILSIFKNMILCKLPIPKKLQTKLEKIMKEFTSEIKEDEKEESEEKKNGI